MQAYREATAVLAAVADPENLRPLGEPTSTVDLTRALGAELIPATGRRLQGAVMLAPDVRQATIQGLAATGRIEEALAANPHERGGRLQEQLERYLLGTAPPLATQELPELEETLQVAVWLGDLIPGIPQPAEVSDRAAYLRLLAPFETIAGDAVFRGRKRELDTLRSYIGVLPPESLLQRIRDIAFKWAEPTRQPALSISGPVPANRRSWLDSSSSTRAFRTKVACHSPISTSTGWTSTWATRSVSRRRWSGSSRRNSRPVAPSQASTHQGRSSCDDGARSSSRRISSRTSTPPRGCSPTCSGSWPVPSVRARTS